MQSYPRYLVCECVRVPPPHMLHMSNVLASSSCYKRARALIASNFAQNMRARCECVCVNDRAHVVHVVVVVVCVRSTQTHTDTLATMILMSFHFMTKSRIYAHARASLLMHVVPVYSSCLCGHVDSSKLSANATLMRHGLRERGGVLVSCEWLHFQTLLCRTSKHKLQQRAEHSVIYGRAKYRTAPRAHGAQCTTQRVGALRVPNQHFQRAIALARLMHRIRTYVFLHKHISWCCSK